MVKELAQDFIDSKIPAIKFRLYKSGFHVLNKNVTTGSQHISPK